MLISEDCVISWKGPWCGIAFWGKTYHSANVPLQLKYFSSGKNCIGGSLVQDFHHFDEGFRFKTVCLLVPTNALGSFRTPSTWRDGAATWSAFCPRGRRTHRCCPPLGFSQRPGFVSLEDGFNAVLQRGCCNAGYLLSHLAAWGEGSREMVL